MMKSPLGHAQNNYSKAAWKRRGRDPVAIVEILGGGPYRAIRYRG